MDMAREITPKQDRRQSVRVKDRILFSYTTVPPDRYKIVFDDFSNGVPPYKQEEYADFHMYIGAQSALAKLRQRDKILADLLQHMDNKINQVLDKLRDGDSPFDRLKFQEVDLSGNGLAFFPDKEVKPGTFIEYNIVLLPDYIYIYGFGEVVSSKKKKTDAGRTIFRTSLKFTVLMDEDREKLIQHNFRQQSLALRQRRRS
ncbi:MAG: PilZ domain-containing protein [Thermodesulfobacteriota bacterium]|nr:PilZ domain-containing protein [Thermodesulfobacteriota bacterium]